MHAALELNTLDIHKRGLALHSQSVRYFRKSAQLSRPYKEEKRQLTTSHPGADALQQPCQLNAWKLARHTKRFQKLVELFSDADRIRELPHVIVDDSLIVVQETIFNIIQTINIFC